LFDVSSTVKDKFEFTSSTEGVVIQSGH
jgi:hypothetical protein